MKMSATGIVERMCRDIEGFIINKSFYYVTITTYQKKSKYGIEIAFFGEKEIERYDFEYEE